MTSRLNARIDAALAKKVAAIRRATRQTTTEVVRTALERYYETIENDASPYETLVESGFVGCAEAPDDLSVTYKTELTRALEARTTSRGSTARKETPRALRKRGKKA
jgi:hypothetical protein